MNNIKDIIKEVVEGATGSGKTYHTINKAKELGNFIYLAPCRQLAYETAMKYGSLEDCISTGEIKINNVTGTNNLYGVYETANSIDLDLFKTLIIDEAHFITDEERGDLLIKLVETFEGNIFLVTATRNFRKPKGFKIVKLASLVSFKKKKISEKEFFKRVEAGEPSIVFTARKSWLPRYGGVVINADTPADERLEIQLAFSRGEINLIESTNVLAQGLNFPATNILIEWNDYDDVEIINQKIGRLGRFGITDENSLLTYTVHKVKRHIPKEVIGVYNDRSIDSPNVFISELKYIIEDKFEHRADLIEMMNDFIHFQDYEIPYLTIGVDSDNDEKINVNINTRYNKLKSNHFKFIERLLCNRELIVINVNGLEYDEDVERFIEEQTEIRKNLENIILGEIAKRG